MDILPFCPNVGPPLLSPDHQVYFSRQGEWNTIVACLFMVSPILVLLFKPPERGKVMILNCAVLYNSGNISNQRVCGYLKQRRKNQHTACACRLQLPPVQSRSGGLLQIESIFSRKREQGAFKESFTRYMVNLSKYSIDSCCPTAFKQLKFTRGGLSASFGFYFQYERRLVLKQLGAVQIWVDVQICCAQGGSTVTQLYHQIPKLFWISPFPGRGSLTCPIPSAWLLCVQENMTKFGKDFNPIQGTWKVCSLPSIWRSLRCWEASALLEGVGRHLLLAEQLVGPWLHGWWT